MAGGVSGESFHIMKRQKLSFLARELGSLTVRDTPFKVLKVKCKMSGNSSGERGAKLVQFFLNANS